MKSTVSAALLKFLSAIPFFKLSGLKSSLYRTLGAQIGEHVKFSQGTFIFVPDFRKLKIGDGVEFGQNVKINCEEIEIGDDTRISNGVMAIGPSALRIGKSCYLFPNVYIDLNEPVIIEDDVGIGADFIFTHSVWQPVTEGGPRKFAPVHIKRGAWIPAGVFIMPGVTVGEKATVGARSLVVHDVPDGCLAVGVPARVIKTAEENRKELSLKEKDKIIREIIDDYFEKIGKNLRIFSENKHVEGSLEIHAIESKEAGKLFGKKRWALVYMSEPVTSEQFGSLKRLCRDFDRVLLLMLPPISNEVIEDFSTKAFDKLTWFSIESMLRKKSWDKDAVALHNFFRSRYGIRFKFQ